jgi:tRNA/tmRNA/rRNA uracil-C5-methylase (TrmA/RlmC/RlmD family)
MDSQAGNPAMKANQKGTSSSSSTKATASKKKKKFVSKKKIPKVGDPDYLSPTQLRNRRKRNAKKKQHQSSSSSSQQQPLSTKSKGENSNNNYNQSNEELKDPSMKYITYPTKTPIIRTAKKYIEPLLQTSENKIFHIYIGPLYHWRTVSKLAVRPDTNNKVAIGLFAENSHSLLPVPKCKAHHPTINQVVEVVTKACHELDVIPYESNTTDNEGKSEEEMGQLRYIGVNIDRSSGGAQITLVWNGKREKKEEKLDKLVDAILSKMVRCGSGSKNESSKSSGDEPPPMKKQRRRGNRGDNNKESQSKDDVVEKKPISKNNNNAVILHSLWINYNSSWKHSNRIFEYDASCWRHVVGPPCITEHLHFSSPKSEGQKGVANPSPPSYPIPLHFPPTVFRQANLDSFTNIVGRIRERVLKLEEKPFCVELYGGVGTIALNLSDAISQLVSSDENPNNYKCFQDSVKQLPAEIQPLLEYKQKNAADMVSTESDLFKKCGLLILDPPRKGLEKEVVDYLCRGECSSIKLLVYVSCGFQAFQRDCEALLASGRYRVDFAEGHVLFPGSDAIETLAFFVPKEE